VAFTKFDRGWLLFFRPAAAAASGPAGAKEVFDRFMDCCGRPLDYLAAANAAAAAAAAAAGADPEDATPFFQRVDVWGTGVLLDYRPRRVSVAALREGSLLELINLVRREGGCWGIGPAGLACRGAPGVSPGS
jgi:hypothetical protein